MVGTESKLLLAALRTQRLFGQDCNLNHFPTSVFARHPSAYFFLHQTSSIDLYNYNYFNILDSIYLKFLLRLQSVLKS